MFRAVPCSSSGGQIVLLQHLVSSLSVHDRIVRRLRAEGEEGEGKEEEEEEEEEEEVVVVVVVVVVIIVVVALSTVNDVKNGRAAFIWCVKKKCSG